jgi:uncharacterized membrane protein YphA (DoxX/SURF4 family)
MRGKYWLAVGASVILGLVLVAAGLGKLLQRAEAGTIFFASYPSYLPDFLLPAFFEVVFTWLPYIELIVGLLLIIGIAARLMAAFSSVLIAGFIANNSWLISQGLGYQPCSGCFGMLERITQARLSTVGALYMDMGMLALALIILFYYPGNFLTTRPWFLGRSKEVNLQKVDI